MLLKGFFKSLLCQAKVEPYLAIKRNHLLTALRYLERCNINQIDRQYGRYVFNLGKIRLLLSSFTEGKRVH